ncbi:N-6 DNA methylase [Methanocaldococcus sp.]|uniref:N-6 DNA methylase n=1 Tax=Methanocaldococcus sp. TaxID=2152917 RepID=UPI0026142AB2|nr:N-6 DNA methylase [Methanocaldococcus sp.]MCQ6253989.1 SAM-dependent methyltransferase [Methanocaldococcus sp.]
MLLEFVDLDNWVKKRGSILFNKFKYEPFTLEEADKVLKEAGIEAENTKELLSILKRKGIVIAKKDPKDRRKRLYQFIKSAKKPTKDDLIRNLKYCADLIRTSVDYKVLLVFLFYKAVSDKYLSLVEKFVKDGYSKTQAYLMSNRSYLKLYDEDEGKLYVWHEVVKSRETIMELANALYKIANLNDNLKDLSKLVEVLGLIGFINEDNMHILEELVRVYNEMDFSEIDYDAIGDAYQWILSYFAPQKCKEGEVYTPVEVVRLIVNLLDIEEDAEVLDPACGSGTMLIESYRYVKDNYGGEVYLYGQERNEIMAILAKLNLILHGIDSEGYEIYVGDSLKNPKFGEVDYTIANPPWNLDGYNENVLKENPEVRKIYNTFVRGGYPPKQSADWAWVQLMIYFARKKAGIVLDNGALFRGGKEKKIRKEIVDKDLIEAIILLPEKLFYNVTAPGIVMILNKNKPEERKGKILFINASLEFEKHPDVRRLNRLGEENIDKIVEVYENWEDVEGFSRVVDLEEIRKNDYNLNVSLYVFPKIEEEEIDIEEVFKELKDIEKEEKEAVNEVMGYVEEILKIYN